MRNIDGLLSGLTTEGRGEMNPVLLRERGEVVGERIKADFLSGRTTLSCCTFCCTFRVSWVTGQLRTSSPGTLSSCPDLFVTYVRSLGLNFEPQPTSKWLADVGFLARVSTSSQYVVAGTVVVVAGQL